MNMNNFNNPINSNSPSSSHHELVHQEDQNQQRKQQTQQNQLSNQHMSGFRNPWYSPSQPSSGAGLVLSQLPTKPSLSGAVSAIPLLQQQQNKRALFANQLPTTYEYDDQRRQLNAIPFIDPPTRADNPFNQYFTNQEVVLGADRRMLAAVDGTYYGYGSYNGTNGSNSNSNIIPNVATANINATATMGSGAAVNSGQYQSQYLQKNPTMPGAMGMMNNRRLLVAGIGSGYKHPPGPERGASYYLPQARVGRSPLIVQYQQYQQSLPTQRLRRRPAPKAFKVYNKFDLNPKIHHQPKYRRCSVNSIHISPVNALSVYLTESYSICQPRKFQYSKSTNPKRVLTKPLDPKFNNGFDNEDSDYILYVNDILGTEEGRKYMVLDLLGSGTFGQVVKCQNLANQSVCAVKVIKSKPAYMNQSLTEVRLLEYLNANSDGKNFIRLLDTFMHKEHLCLVFELLASNLYELIKQNQFQGLNMKLVKLLTRQLLEAMAQLRGFQMIHCDLKPENILLCQPDKPDIKVIDFGSACFARQTIYTYIQSRFYRSPEVILGLPYTESIDMWSLGCIVGELFLGLPMFPGTSEYNQIWKIVDMLGIPPRHMLEVGRNSMNFFKKIPAGPGETRSTYLVKTYDEYLHFLETSKSKEDHPKKEQPNKNYFKHRILKDIILNYKLPSKKMTNSMIEKECLERLLLIDFLSKVLNLNPLERLTPQEALKHPFVVDVRTVDSTSSLTLSGSSDRRADLIKDDNKV